MTRPRAFVLIALAAIAGGCAGTEVLYDYDLDADFAR